MIRTIQFYFDYISPNAYLAWVQLHRLAAQHSARIEPLPVLFAGLLEAHGQLGPAEVPPKALWMFKNNLRKAALLGVPLNPPAFHPFNPLLALRASSVPLDGAARTALIGALFEAVWVRGLHVSEPAVLARVASDIGLDAAALVASAELPAAKQLLREQTDAAIARGIFGVPSMAVGEEVFWGYDDLPFLALLLEGKDPLGVAERAKAATPPRPSAVRRRAARGS